MKNTELLIEDIRAIIANEVGRIYPQLRKLPEKVLDSEGKLGETFSVWVLRTEIDEMEKIDDISSLAMDTGFWHSQVHIDDVSNFIVRSHNPVDENNVEKGWQVGQFLTSDLAQEVDQAIEFIDRQDINFDAAVRILEVPVYDFTCFWLYNHDKKIDYVVIISHSEDTIYLKKELLYESTDFMEALLEEPRKAGMYKAINTESKKRVGGN